MTITILDYGVGNLGSVQKAIVHLGYPVTVTQDAATIADGSVLVVPGQGAAGDAMQLLRDRNLADPIRDYIRSGKPYLGICLGYQLLFDYSEEDGGQEALGIFAGQVRRFDSNQVKVPQMGWNQLTIMNDPHRLAAGLPYPSFAYFANSYYTDPEDSSIVFTETHYGRPFASSIQTNTVLGCQFHPEKSGDVGLHIIKEFLKRHA